MTRRGLAMLVVLALGAAGAAAYSSAARDREYRRLLSSADAALAAGQPTLAVEALTGALTLRPGSMAAYLKRGELYRAHGDLPAALRDLRKAHELDPAAVRPLEQLGDVSYSLGQFERAVERYQAAADIDDSSPQRLYKLALALHQTGRTPAAAPVLQQALALNDRFAEAHYLLGVVLHADGQHERARTALLRAVELAPEMAPAREALAAVHRALGQPRDALEQHEALAALEPDRPERRLAVALALADAGRTDLAVRRLAQTADRFPDVPGVYKTLGEIWLRAAERGADESALGKAVAALRTALLRGAADSRTHALYGRALLRSGRTGEALAALREATAQRPVADSAFLWLAEAAERAGRTREARDALVRHATVAINGPSLITVAARIGDLSDKLGEAETAARWLERAAEPPTADPALLLRLAEVERAAGHHEAARRAVARGLQRAPDHARLRRMQQALEEEP